MILGLAVLAQENMQGEAFPDFLAQILNYRA